MKTIKMVATTLFSLTTLSCASTSTHFNSENWVSPEGLLVTESVYYDQTNESIYVSNINGKPTEMNLEGFISKIDMNGKVDALKWVTGMNAPKGMGVYEGKLYVSDINQVHIIDVQKGVILNSVKVDDAQFLNDISIDSNGNVYISDTSKSRITQLKDGKISTWLELTEFKKPNGLLIEGDDLLVGTSAGMVRINLETKLAQLEIPLNGGIDGLKPVGDGYYVVSDWKGKIQKISANSEPVVLSDTSGTGVYAADFEYIHEYNALLVPTFFDNKVTLFKL